MEAFVADPGAAHRDALRSPRGWNHGWGRRCPEAIREIRRLDPDMVILDIRMAAENA